MKPCWTLPIALFLLSFGPGLAQESDPEQPAALRLMADRAYTQAAEALARDLAQKPEERTELLLGLARIRAGQLDQGIAALEPLAKKPGSPWRLRALYLIAEACVLKRDYARAAELYSRAVAELLAPEHKAELAQVYVDLGRRALQPDRPGLAPNPAKAAGLFALALEFPLQAKSREELLRARAEALVKAGAHADAAAAFAQLLAEFPKSPGAAEAGLQQALQTLEAGNRLEARRLLSALLARPDAAEVSARAHVALARTFGLPQPSSARDLERGVAALRRFIEAHPGDRDVPGALLQIAQAYGFHSRTEEAITALRELIRRFGSKPELEELAQARVQLGGLLASQSRYDEAMEVFQAYLREHPAHRDWANVQSWLVDAEYERAMHLFRDAEAALAEAPAGSGLDAAKAKVAATREALERFLAAHPLEARNPDALYTIAETHALEKDDATATDALRRLTSKYPGTEQASRGQLRIAELLEAQGRLAEALEAYQKVEGAWAGQAAAKASALQQPSLEVQTMRSFRSSEKPTLRLRVRNVPVLTLKSYRLNLETYFRKTHSAAGIESLDIALIAPDSTWKAEIPGYRPLEQLELDLPLPFEEAGCWLLHAESETLEATTMVLVSDLDLLVRHVGRDTLVYAEDPGTGKAVQGAAVLLATAERLVAEGKTGPDGVWLHRAPESEGDLGSALRVFGSIGASVAATDLDSVSGDVGSKVISRAILFTDRPLYRPGDRVGIKAFVRVEDNGVLKSGAGRVYTLDAIGPTGQVLLSRKLALSAWGSLDAGLVLPQAVAQGRYRLRLHDEKDSFEDGFEVRHYALPKVLLAVEPAGSTVPRGTPVEGVIRARHSYGEPLAGARVRYGLRTDPLAEGRTDAQGELRFSFPTTEMGETQRLDIVAELPDEANAAAAGATVVLAPAQFELSVSTSSELYLAGERFEATVRAADLQGKPHSPQVLLELVEQRGASMRGQVETLVASEAVKLDAQGVGRAGFQASRGGQYVLRASAADALGNPVGAERTVQISGEDDEQRLHLFSDVTSLMVGQKAALRLHSRLGRPVRALVSFEGDGLFGYRLEPVAPGEGRLEVEALGGYAPNFAVQVSAMADGRLHEARSEFSVRQGLTIEIEPKQRSAPPGTEVEALIRTFDHLGRPVSAEVALAVVDEALLALHPDPHASMASIFYGGSRSLKGQGACSCSFAYRPETRSISKEVLSELAKVQQSARRAARLDDLSQLMANAPAAPAEAPSIAFEADQRAAGEKMEALGYAQTGTESDVIGGLAGAREGLAPPPPPGPLVRKRFAETAFWSASVVTDAAGRASVRFRMPDSTTGWHWLARGADREMLVGQAEAASLTKLELVADVHVPLAFVEGDKATVRATAHNLGAAPREVATRFAWQLAGQTGTEAGALKLAPSERGTAELGLTAATAGELTLTWNAGTDVIERRVPVLPWGVEEVDQKVGVATGERIVTVELPAAASQRRALQVRLGLRWDRLLLDLWRGSDVTICVRAASHAEEAYEVLLASAALAEEEKRGRGKEAAELRGALALALGELVAGQNSDGGWAYAGRSGSDPLVSAEALVALARAAAVGFEEIVRAPRKSAENRLLQWFREAQEDQIELKASLLWALAESTEVDYAYLNRLYRSRNALSTLSLARLAGSMVRAKHPEVAAELVDLLIRRRAPGDGAPFGTKDALSDGVDPVVVAAFALEALALGRPGAVEIGSLRDWLLSQRLGAGYGLRRRDAWAAVALAAAGSGVAEATSGRFRLDLRVNGQPLRQVEVGEGAADPGTIEAPASMLRPGKNEVAFALSGRGRYSYAVRLSGWNPAPRERVRDWHVRRLYGPAPLVRGGREIPRGFGVVDGSSTAIENRVTELELGAFLEANLSIWRRSGDQPAALRSSHLIVEEPLPAGCTLDPGSVAGDFLAFEEQPGRVVFLLPRDRWSYNLRFRLLGRFPGAYGVLPTRVFAPDESGRADLGAAGKLTVLGPGVKSHDTVRLTPDELYHLGLWHFERGELEQARAHLDTLVGGTRLRDAPARESSRRLFQIADRLNRTRDMIRHFETVKERWPDSVLTFEEVLRVGQAYREQGEHERGWSVLRAAAEGSFLRDSQVSGALEREGELDASIEVLESLLRDYPPHPTMDAAAYGLGQLLVLVAQGKGPVAPRGELATPAAAFRRAARVLQTFIVEHPDSLLADEVSFAWLSALLEAEDHPAAVTLARRFQSRYPKSVFLPSFEYGEGFALFELRRYQDALGVLSRVAQGKYRRSDGSEGPSPNRALSLLLTGQIHQASNNLEAALGLYEQVQQEFPEARELRDYYLRHSLSLPEVTTVLPGEPARVELSQTNLEQIQLLVYKVDLMMLYLREKNLNTLTGIELTGIEPDHEEMFQVPDGDRYRERKVAVELPLKEPGAYLVVARSGEVDASGMVLVSELELVADEQPGTGRVRLFLEDQKSKQPVGRAHVKVVGSRDGVFQSGDTDLRGIFTADNVQGVVTAIARGGEHYAFYRGHLELSPVALNQEPVFDSKQKALENLRRDFEQIQQQRMEDLRGIQFNEAQGVEVKKAYK
jgi:hypothetical protein